MIDPKELRIGNWTMGRQRSRMLDTSYQPGPTYNEPPSAVQVREIYNDLHGLAVNRERLDRLSHTEWAELEGIPLTPELLEQCGMEYSRTVSEGVDRIEFWTKDLGQLRVFELRRRHKTPEGVFLYGVQGAQCAYLHQLQNLFFCLCGQELEVSL